MRRVAIAVLPRLLGDALSRALRRDDVEVAVYERPSELVGLDQHFDVAVISGDTPEQLDIEVVIHLPVADPAGGSVTTREGTHTVDLRDVSGISSAIDRFSAP